MKYASKTFSIAVGSDDYRKNFDAIFRPPTPISIWAECRHGDHISCPRSQTPPSGDCECGCHALFALGAT